MVFPAIGGMNLAQAAGAGGVGAGSAVVAGHVITPVPGKRHLREAESAYLAGAKKLEHDDLDAAEMEFQRALKLNPENSNYAVAISVTRGHRVSELVRHASLAREAGDLKAADTLLAEARATVPGGKRRGTTSDSVGTTRECAWKRPCIADRRPKPDGRGGRRGARLEDQGAGFSKRDSDLPGAWGEGPPFSR